MGMLIFQRQSHIISAFSAKYSIKKSEFYIEMIGGALQNDDFLLKHVDFLI